MTTDVITIAPESSVKSAARRMVEAGISGLIVTDNEDCVVGVVSEADFVKNEAQRSSEKRAGLLRWFLRPAKPDVMGPTVADIMTSPVVTIGPDESHAKAAWLMDQQQVKRLPVVEDGRLLGIVSRADIVRSFTRSDAEIHNEIVEELMPHVLWIEPTRVRVTVEDGVVYMRGRLATKADAQLLEFMTRKVRGVVGVKASLQWEFDPEEHENAPLLQSPFATFSRR